MADEQEQTAVEEVVNAERKVEKTVENHQPEEDKGKEIAHVSKDDVKGSEMDIDDDKEKLEVAKEEQGEQENDKGQEDQEKVEEDVVEEEKAKEEEAEAEEAEAEAEEVEQVEEEEEEEEVVAEEGKKEKETKTTTKKTAGRPKKGRAKSEELSTPRGRGEKRQRQKKEIFPFFTDRPTRERKSIERFIASVEKETNKDIEIKQGQGTVFKDIPNVAYKLSKISRNDEILSMLHSLLFHKRAKATVLKQHILQFSGYVWTENKEKERARVKDKLERYTKEGLVLLIDVLDLHLPRTGKKEELVGKVLEFLEKPHKTTDVLLEEKEQEKQLKSARKRSSGKKTPGRLPKKHKVDGEPSAKRGRRKAAEESDNGESAKSEDDDALEEEEEEEVEKKQFTFTDEDDEEDEDFDEEEEKKKSAKKSSKTSSKDNSKVVPETKEVSSEEDEDEEEEEEEEEKSEAEEVPPRKSQKKTPAKISVPDSPPIVSPHPVEKVYTKNARRQNKEKEKEKEKETEKVKATGKGKGKGKETAKEKEKREKEKEKEKEKREKEKEKEKERKEKEKEKEGKEKEKEKERKEKEKKKEKETTPKRGPGRPRKSDVTPERSETKSKFTKSAAKEKDLAQAKKKSDTVKESKPRKSKKVPSDDKLQSEIRELLKDADFSKVTFTDVITQLEGTFGVSLTEHKSHVKKLIKEEISKLADEGDDEPEKEAGPGSQGDAEGEAEGEAEAGADAEVEGEPEPESEVETEAEAVAELKTTEQEEKSEIQAEAEVGPEAAQKVEAEASQAGEAQEVEIDVTKESADVVLETETTPKPGPELVPTLETQAEENSKVDAVTQAESKTVAIGTEKIEEIVVEKQDGAEKAAFESKESIEQMVEGDDGE